MNKWVFIITFNQYSSLFIGENATGGPSPQHACTKPALALLPGPAHVSIARGRAATYADAGAAPLPPMPTGAQMDAPPTSQAHQGAAPKSPKQEVDESGSNYVQQLQSK